MRSVEVLHVSEVAKGGVGTYLNLLGETAGAAIRNRFVIPDCHQSYMADGLDCLPYPAARTRAGSFRNLRHAADRAINRYRPDILFAHSSFALPLLPLLRVRPNRPRLIYCPHGWSAMRYRPDDPRHALFTRIEKYLTGAADATINISERELEFAQAQRYRGQHLLLENAVLDRQQQWPDPDAVKSRAKTINLLFVGRFDRQKGLDRLLDAFERTRKSRTDLHLHLAGEPCAKDQDLRLPESDPAITRLGWVGQDKIDPLYASADAIVVPSRWEGFGLVVAEAFRNGTPAIVADTGALPHLVEHGRTGLIFDGSVDALSHCLIGLSKPRLAAMRAPARAAFEARFAPAAFAQRISDLYCRLLPENTETTDRQITAEMASR